MSLNEPGFQTDTSDEELIRRERNRQALEAIINGHKAPVLQVKKRPSVKQHVSKTRRQLHNLGDAFQDTFSKITQGKSLDTYQTALVPLESISGRALIIVIIIMTFLASMTAGAVEMISEASSGWSTEIAREMTIQIRPKLGRNIENDLSAVEKLTQNLDIVSSVIVFSKTQSEQLLEPWLGTSLNLDQIPVPRIVVLKLKTDKSLDFTRSIQNLKQDLQTNIPTATLDDHRKWGSRLETMAGTMVFSGIFILILVLVATTLAIAFATRGAMAGTREIINVLHLVGAEDRFIADEFQRHFLKLGARGGAVGGMGAILVFFAAGKVSQSLALTPQGDQLEALFGSFSLGLRGYAAIFAIMLLVAALTAIITRVTVYRNLQGLD